MFSISNIFRLQRAEALFWRAKTSSQLYEKQPAADLYARAHKSGPPCFGYQGRETQVIRISPALPLTSQLPIRWHCLNLSYVWRHTDNEKVRSNYCSIAVCLSQIRVADKQDVQIDWKYVIGIIDQALSIVIKQDVQIAIL